MKNRCNGTVTIGMIDTHYTGLDHFQIIKNMTEGQYCGKMLAETGSFDILLGIGYWVLLFSSYIHKYIYIHIYLGLGIGVYTCMTYVHTYYMVSYHETTHSQDQGPIPICVIEYG